VESRQKIGKLLRSTDPEDDDALDALAVALRNAGFPEPAILMASCDDELSFVDIRELDFPSVEGAMQGWSRLKPSHLGFYTYLGKGQVPAGEIVELGEWIAPIDVLETGGGDGFTGVVSKWGELWEPFKEELDRYWLQREWRDLWEELELSLVRHTWGLPYQEISSIPRGWDWRLVVLFPADDPTEEPGMFPVMVGDKVWPELAEELMQAKIRCGGQWMGPREKLTGDVKGPLVYTLEEALDNGIRAIGELPEEDVKFYQHVQKVAIRWW
jgi:hypothetical protein